MPTEHTIRTVAILLAWLGVGAVYLYLLVEGASGGVAARLEGMLAVLTPAVLDTMRVAKRERSSLHPPPPKANQ